MPLQVGLQPQTRTFTMQQLARVLGYLMQGLGTPPQLLVGGAAAAGADEDGWLLSLLESCRHTDEAGSSRPEEGSGSNEEGSGPPEEGGIPGVAAPLEPG